MEVARLVLDYLQVLAWPLLVVIVLLIARKSLPAFLADLARRLKSIKAGGAELEFSPAQEAVVEAVAQLEKATELGTGGQPDLLDLSPELRRLTPRSSASKIFRNMRVTLYHQVEEVCRGNRLPVIWEGEPTLERTRGLLLSAPSWQDITDTMRNIASASHVEGWDHLADAVEAMADFAKQDLPSGIKSATASLLSRNAINTLSQLAAATSVDSKLS